MNSGLEIVQVRVRAFAAVRQALGASEVTVELPAGATVAHLLEHLAAEYPTILPVLGRTIVTVNQSYADHHRPVVAGDEIAIFPPVSGGCPQTHVAISQTPIDVVALSEQVTEPGAGAVVTFAGVVRGENLGRPVDYLEYEAYTEMAEARLRQVVAEAREQWPKIRRVALVHRVGHLELGEVAVLVAIGAAHRDDGAFEAARYAIDRIKEIVPVWKKEGWADGEEWLEGQYRPRPGE
jgi:molybdopterin converting factor subunit 1